MIKSSSRVYPLYVFLIVFLVVSSLQNVIVVSDLVTHVPVAESMSYYNVGRAEGTLITLFAYPDTAECPITQFVITSLPKEGSLYQVDSSGNRAARIRSQELPLAISSSNPRIIYQKQKDFTGGFESFSFFSSNSNGDSAESKISLWYDLPEIIPLQLNELQSEPPVALNSSYYMIQNTFQVIEFTFTDPDILHGGSQQYNISITSLSSNVTLYEVNQTIATGTVLLDNDGGDPIGLDSLLGNQTKVLIQPNTDYVTPEGDTIDIGFTVMDSDTESPVSNQGFAKVSVFPSNSPPSVSNGTYTISEDTAIVISFSISDPDIISHGDIVTICPSQPTEGALMFTAPSGSTDGQIVDYFDLVELFNDSCLPFGVHQVAVRPMDHFNSPPNVLIDFYAIDLIGETSEFAQISIKVTPVNDPPITQDISITVLQGGYDVITLEAYDVDISTNGDSFSIHLASLPDGASLFMISEAFDASNGIDADDAGVPITGPGEISQGPVIIIVELNETYYSPPNISFTYFARDSLNAESISTVSVQVNHTNTPVIAFDKNAIASEDTIIAITFPFTDPDIISFGDIITIEIQSVVHNAKLFYLLSPQPDESVIAESELGSEIVGTGNLIAGVNQIAVGFDQNYFSGSLISFNFSAFDSSNEYSETKTVSIQVTPVNDPPVPLNSTLNISDYQNVAISFHFLDVDVGIGDNFAVTIVSIPPSVQLFYLVGVASEGDILDDSQISTEEIVQGDTLPFNIFLVAFKPQGYFGGLTVSIEFEVQDDGDGDLLSTGTGLVSITVGTVNERLQVSDVIVDGFEDTPVFFEVQIIDNDSSTFGLTFKTAPVLGSLRYITDNVEIDTNGQRIVISETNPVFEYIPNSDLFGSPLETLEIQADDFTPDVVMFTVEIHIASVNDKPVISLIPQIPVIEDTPTLIDISSFVSDVDLSSGDALQIILQTYPLNGNLYRKMSSTFSSIDIIPSDLSIPNLGYGSLELWYLPNLDYSGPDSFILVVQDTGTNNVSQVLESDEATVSLSVLAVNDPPVATGASLVQPENSVFRFTLDAYDVDSISFTTTITEIPDLAMGTLYEMEDTGNSSFGRPETIIATSGYVVTNPRLQLMFRPNIQQIGILGQLTFVLNDGEFSSVPAVVSFTTTEVNNFPIVRDFNVQAVDGIDLPIDFSSHIDDVDSVKSSLQIRIHTLPSEGTLRLGSQNVQELEFLPVGQFKLTFSPNLAVPISPPVSSSFVFSVNDGFSSSSVKTVTINIAPSPSSNLQPVAQSFVFNMSEDAYQVIDLLENVIDDDNSFALTGVDPGVIKISIVSGFGQLYQFERNLQSGSVIGDEILINGSIVTSSEGKVVFNPPADYFDENSEQYVFSFSAQEGDPETVLSQPLFARVSPVNDPPVVSDFSANCLEGSSVTLQANVSDVESDPITCTLEEVFSNPSGGSLSQFGSAVEITDSLPVVLSDPLLRFEFTSNTFYTGYESMVVSYTCFDGQDRSNLGVITINIENINDPPIVSSFVTSTTANIPVFIDFVVQDPDDDDVSIEIQSLNRTFGDFYEILDSTGDLNFEAEITTTPHTVTKFGTRIAFVPLQDFETIGVQIITYSATDRYGLESTASATVTLEIGSSIFPVVESFTVHATEDITERITLRATSINGNPLIYSILEIPVNGRLFKENGDPLARFETFTSPFVDYIPDANVNGENIDAFIYSASDGPMSSKGTVAISIAAVNDIPAPIDQSFEMDEDSIKVIDLRSVDDDGNENWTAIVQTQPSQGLLYQLTPTGELGAPITLFPSDVLDGAGTGHGVDDTHRVVYIPFRDVNGLDSFTFRARDTEESGDGLVSIVIRPVNDPPFPRNDPEVVAADENIVQTVPFDLVDVENDFPLYVRIQSLTELGTLVVSGESVIELTDDLLPFEMLSTQILSFTPLQDVFGEDSFMYTTFDGSDESDDSFRYNVVINSVVTLPIPQNRSYALNEDDTVLIILEALFVEEDNRWTAVIESLPSLGILYQMNENGTIGSPITLNSDVSFRAGSSGVHRLFFEQTVGFSADIATDSFTFKARNSENSVSAVSGTISFSITNLNDPPVAVSKTVNLNEDTPTRITLQGTDEETPSDQLLFFLSSAVSPGKVFIDASLTVEWKVGDFLANLERAFWFSPGPDEYGSPFSTVSFSVRDDIQVSLVPGVITINVAPVNDPPRPFDLFKRYDEDSGDHLIEFEFIDVDIADQNVAFYAIIIDLPVGATLFTKDLSRNAPSERISETQFKNLRDAGSDLTSVFLRSDLDYASPPNITFTYSVCDELECSPPAKVEVLIDPINDAPRPTDITVIVQEDIAIEFELDWFDPENASVQVHLMSLPKGTLFVSGSSQPIQLPFSTSADALLLIFQPDDDDFGTAFTSFQFILTDDKGAESVSGAVTFDIIGSPDEPTAPDVQFIVQEDSRECFLLPGFDVDKEEIESEIISIPTDTQGEFFLFDIFTAASNLFIKELGDLVTPDQLPLFVSNDTTICYFPAENYFNDDFELMGTYSVNEVGDTDLPVIGSMFIHVAPEDDDPIATFAALCESQDPLGFALTAFEGEENCITLGFDDPDNHPPSEISVIVASRSVDGMYFNIDDESGEKTAFSGGEVVLTSEKGKIIFQAPAVTSFQEIITATLTYFVRDITGRESNRETVTITVKERNYPPFIDNSPQTVLENQGFQVINIPIIDEDRTTVTVEITWVPNDLSLNGLYTVNLYEFNLDATQNVGNRLICPTQICSQVIASVGENPIWRIIAEPDERMLESFSFNLNVTAVDNAGLSTSTFITVQLVTEDDPPELVSYFVVGQDQVIPIEDDTITYAISDASQNADPISQFCVIVVDEDDTIQSYLITNSIPSNGLVSISVSEDFFLCPGIYVTFNPNGDGGGVPYTNFTVTMEGPAENSISATLKVTLSVQCPVSTDYINVWSTGSLCKPCPVGGQCSRSGKYLPTNRKGFTLSPLFETEGFIFISCNPSSACQEEPILTDSLPGGFSGLTANVLSSISDSFRCSPGYTGSACGQCGDGYFRSGGLCKQCPEDDYLKWIILALLMIFFILSMGFFTAINADFTAFRILINYIQLISYFTDIGLQWPPQVKSLFNQLSIVNLNFEYLSLECSVDNFDFFDKWVLTMIIPLFLIGFIILFMILVRSAVYSGMYKRIVLFIDRRRTTKPVFANRDAKDTHYRNKESEANAQALNIAIRTYIQLLMLTYLILVFAIAEFFDCSSQADGTATLRSQPSVICYEGEWRNYLAVAILGILGYGAGVPLLFYVILYIRPFLMDTDTAEQQFKARDIPCTSMTGYSDMKAWRARFDPLTTSYQEKYFYWELFIIARKFTVGILQLLAVEYPTFRATFVLMVMLGYTIIHFNVSRHSPIYAMVSNDVLEIVSNASSCLILTAGLMLTTDQDYSGTVETLIAYVIVVLIALTSIAISAVFLYSLKGAFASLLGRSSFVQEMVRRWTEWRKKDQEAKKEIVSTRNTAPITQFEFVDAELPSSEIEGRNRLDTFAK